MTPNGEAIRRVVRAALDEDIGTRDVTTESTVPESANASAVLIAKQELVVAGLDVAAAAFRALDPRVRWEAHGREGERFFPATIIASVEGRARALLGAERVALNFLQRLSGVATLTRRFVDLVAGTGVQIRDTRKTTPLLRTFEKYAVEVGGGVPHRERLDSGILVKDNHIRLAGSVRVATLGAVAGSEGLTVEVEVESLQEVDEALFAGAQMLLLDNFTPEAVALAIKRVGGRVPIEVSGGVNLSNVRSYAEVRPDFIAVGALTHSAPAVDIAMEIEQVSGVLGSAAQPQRQS